MKRIVFFIQNFSRSGGSERVTSMIANGLCRAGHQVSILSICGDNTSFFPLERGVKLYTLVRVSELDNRKDFLKVMSRLRRFYRSHRTDLVIDVFPALSIYTIPLKKLMGFKSISWEHYNHSMDIGMNKPGRKLAARFADMIVTLTETDRQNYLANERMRCPIAAIPNPSPFQDAQPAEVRKRQIITVGRLAYEKAFYRAVYIWSLLEPRTDWELLIFGEGEERPRLEELIRKKGLTRIHLMGAVRDIAGYYRESAVYLSTSRFEGLPMTMLEAQSFGLPIVSYTYETGPREIITPGVDGILIPEGSERDMICSCARELDKLMKDTPRLVRMQAAAKESSARFDCGRIMAQWTKIVEGI